MTVATAESAAGGAVPRRRRTRDWSDAVLSGYLLLVACIVFILINMAVFRVGIRDIAK
jgi:uncharacterized integral membrane protein